MTVFSIGRRCSETKLAPQWVLPRALLVIALGLFTVNSVRTATVLENFEQAGSDGFPAKWRMSNEKAKKVYRIESEKSNRFLRARANNQAVQIGLEHIFDPTNQPRLKWRWRVHQLANGAD